MSLFDLRLSHLSVAGWVLLLLSLASIVLVAAVIGPWALDSIGRGWLRRGMAWIAVLLAVPGILTGVVVWVLGARLLARRGMAVVRDEADDESPP